MTLSISDFKAALTLGGARPTLFQVAFNNPYNISGPDNFLVKAASIPAETMSEIKLSYMGREAKFPGNRTYADWSATVYNDEDFAIRKGLERWMAAANDPELNTRSNDARSDITITQLDKAGAAIAQYVLRDGWPKEIGQIELSWDNNDQVETYTVAFAYDYFIPKSVVTPA